VATAGPSSFGEEQTLIAAGATCIRLNASHLAPDDVVEHCRRITAQNPLSSCVIDLQGAKMRLADNAPRQVQGGETIRLSCDPSLDDALYVPHPELFEQSHHGDRLSLDDGRLLLEVSEVHPSSLCARADRDYLILPRKGLNRQDHPIYIEDLSATDRELVCRCQGIGNTYFAVSFVVDGREAAWVKRRAPDARVALKLERREALMNLELIARCADELWICRGDLGAQLGIFDLGRAVSAIVPSRFGVPVLMAGQVLEHLTMHTEPTRSEVCHLHDLVALGYAGIVLSDETAIGEHPALAARWARQLLTAG
jgi:pyruvate kinase